MGNLHGFFSIMSGLLALVLLGSLAACRGVAPDYRSPTPYYGSPASNSNEVSTPQEVNSIRVRLVAEGFTAPLGLIPVEDGTGRLFVVDQVGTISILTRDGKVLAEPFLDLRERMVNLNPAFDERGLLGLAFHPAFKQNGRFFVYYSAPLRQGGPAGWDHTSHISEFKVMPSDPDKADAGSERRVLQVDQPQANHNAGQIAFGPDGLLYIPLGDGGGAHDTGFGHSPGGNGQDINTLLGKILRIDVDGAMPYGIPPDNPFVGTAGRDEIYALGLRNPFRISFDAGGSRELFVGDVGQRQWEEVNVVTKGGNYGWNLKEGAHFFDPDNPAQSPLSGPDVDARGQPLIDPIIEYSNANAPGGIGMAVIGGFIYRGTALPALAGQYVFGDYGVTRARPSGIIFAAVRPAAPGQMWPSRELKVTDHASGRIDSFIRSFGQDLDKELYVLSADNPGPSGKTGKVFKIVP